MCCCPTAAVVGGTWHLLFFFVPQRSFNSFVTAMLLTMLPYLLYSALFPNSCLMASCKPSATQQQSAA